MQSLKILIPLLFLLFCGCGSKTSYSSMSPVEQSTLKKNLERLAFAYEQFTLENGKGPSNWADLDRFVIDTEMEVDFQIVKDAGYTVNWNLDGAARKEEAGGLVIAQDGGDGPKVYLDGEVK